MCLVLYHSHMPPLSSPLFSHCVPENNKNGRECSMSNRNNSNSEKSLLIISPILLLLKWSFILFPLPFSSLSFSHHSPSTVTISRAINVTIKIKDMKKEKETASLLWLFVRIVYTSETHRLVISLSTSSSPSPLSLFSLLPISLDHLSYFNSLRETKVHVWPTNLHCQMGMKNWPQWEYVVPLDILLSWSTQRQLWTLIWPAYLNDK